MHSTIDRMIKEVGNSRCISTKVVVEPMPIAYLLTAFIFTAIGSQEFHSSQNATTVGL